LLFSQAVNRETEMPDGGLGSEPVQPELTIPPAGNRATNPINPAPLSRETSIFVTEYDSRLSGVVSAVTGCGFEPLDRVIQPFLMRRGKGPELNADSVTAGPADDGALNQDRGLSFMDIEQEIHFHACGGTKGTLETTSFAREIQRFADSMNMILVDEGPGKRRWKSGMLSDHHNSALFCNLDAG
jgi:hypothetical protein